MNNPAIFVATTLVGNNIANYITSFAVVLGVGTAFGSAASSELIGTVLMTPIVFVFGELLPKYLFYHAPYQLITAIRPLLLLATVLFTADFAGAGAAWSCAAENYRSNSVSTAIGNGSRRT